MKDQLGSEANIQSLQIYLHNNISVLLDEIEGGNLKTNNPESADCSSQFYSKFGEKLDLNPHKYDWNMLPTRHTFNMLTDF